VLLTGEIQFGPTSIPCVVRNLSETGAAIEANSPLWFPDQFILWIERDNSRRWCRIVWRRDKRIGVHFDESRPA
jgi:PilZ domain